MSALLASILLFFIITVVLTAMGFKFWVVPQSAVERVMGDVEMSHHNLRNPSLRFRELLAKIGDIMPSNPANVGIIQKRLIAAGIRDPRALHFLYGAGSTGQRNTRPKSFNRNVLAMRAARGLPTSGSP